MANPIRNRILAVLKQRFLDVADGVGGHIITWNVVERKPLEDQQMEMGNAIALLEGPETKRDEVQRVRASLTLLTEFWVRLELGDEPSDRLNRVMGDIYLTMRGTNGQGIYVLEPDDTQLALDIQERRNELDVGGPGDTLVGGVVEWEILYRHHANDQGVLC